MYSICVIAGCRFHDDIRHRTRLYAILHAKLHPKRRVFRKFKLFKYYE